MLSSIVITPIAHGNKKPAHEIYSDVSGGFYDKKLIDECPKEIVDLCYRYQIFKGILDEETNKPRVEYNMNCLLYAFTASGKFTEEDLNSMKSRCYTRIVSKKDLTKLCIEYGIKVILRKWKKDVNKWNDVETINKDG